MHRLITVVTAALALAVTAPAGADVTPPPIKHVFVIVLENKGYDETFGPGSPAPYLSQQLTAQGQLLTQYYGIAHQSLANYIAMVSGQAPNGATQSDCQIYTDVTPGTMGADGQAVGQGCVYPAWVKTIADQLAAKGLGWKGYMEDMGTNCRHPAFGQPDDTQTAEVGDQYAARHNPFVYFHSLLDSGACAANDVPLDRLPGDLAAAATTPSYAFITPNLCHDGHDQPCVNGEPGGLVSADAFLQEWVPRITSSAAFKRDGLLLVTFDESESGAEDCCGEPMGPNTPNNGGLEQGNGGGRTGTVLISPYIKAGSVNDTPYNHYSLLRSTEDLFGLAHLGYAANTGLKPFEDDVFNNPAGDTKFNGNAGGGNNGGGNNGGGPRPKITLRGVPHHCVERAFTARIGIRSNKTPSVKVRRDGRLLASRRSKKLKVRVGIADLESSRHRLTVTASNGRSSAKSASFRVCDDS